MSKSTFSRRSFVAQAVGMNLLMSHGWKTMAAAWDKLEWKAALGMNGFASAIQKYGTAFEIEDILEFAGSVNFGGVELVENWPHPQYPSSSDRDAIKKLSRPTRQAQPRDFFHSNGSWRGLFARSLGTRELCSRDAGSY